ncbi:MAG TPA: hypothetical protein DDY18_02905 [Flavobacterium sp.]|nr:hypothetical protein [Flavobacterium sp.]
MKAMKTKILYLISFLMVGIGFTNCTDEEYSLGDLNAPTNLVINTEIIGQNTENPDGDGSGDVIISVTADGAIGYKIDYGTAAQSELVSLSSTTVTKRYSSTGTYLITVVAYGSGGSSTTATKEITVRSDFNVEPEIVTYLTNNSSKTWVVDKDVPGHLGVGPWEGSSTPEWWSSAIDEKVACCNCFYTSTFTFSFLAGSNSYQINVATPDGAFTKTGALSSIPGIPASGDEGCYSYGGAVTPFTFTGATSGIADSTQTAILLGGTTSFIGYGALQKSYEIIELTENYMYLRVQGTETGNAWYLKLKPAL